jgi:hypothetical protein
LYARASIGTPYRLSRNGKKKDCNESEKFGLRQDDEKEDEAREEGCDMSGERSLPTGLSNEPVCGDKLPNAEVAFCDWKKSCDGAWEPV